MLSQDSTSHSTSVSAIRCFPSVKSFCKSASQYGVLLKSYSPAPSSYSTSSLYRKEMEATCKGSSSAPGHTKENLPT